LERRILAVDGQTGKELWSIPSSQPPHGAAILRIDPSGRRLFAMTDPSGKSLVIEMPSGKQLFTMDKPINGLGPDAELWVRGDNVPLFKGREDKPVVRLDPNEGPKKVVFSPNGGQVAWGCSDGAVKVVNLREVRERLEKVRLGW
jgi:WD40 repeat protein